MATQPSKPKVLLDDSELDAWRREQRVAIGARGASNDVAEQEAYNARMLRQNLNAYVCHEQLDAYMRCLSEKQLRASDELGRQRDVNKHSHVQQTACHGSYTAYTTCMDTADNQTMVIQQAVLEPNCDDDRVAMLRCMNAARDEETRTGKAQCMDAYRQVLRCGLNHLWERYWRALTRIRDVDDVKVMRAVNNPFSSEYKDFVNFIVHEQPQQQQTQEKQQQ